MTVVNGFSKATMETCSSAPCFRFGKQFASSSMTTVAALSSLSRTRVQPPWPPLRDAFAVTTTGLLLPMLLRRRPPASGPAYGTDAFALSPQPLTTAADVLTMYLTKVPSLAEMVPSPPSRAIHATSSSSVTWPARLVLLLSSESLNPVLVMSLAAELKKILSASMPGRTRRLAIVCRPWMIVGVVWNRSGVRAMLSHSSAWLEPSHELPTFFSVRVVPTSITLPSVSVYTPGSAAM
mmetsp:Transcript_4327/g.11749  ORF Transcript_4327/g.11749 Transcript_4327/m.11749 type:complete len:237 (+) Transcript_4327:149-859(+)